MGVISNILGYVLNWIYNLCNNYGLAIIIFSILLRAILLPVTIKQQKSMKKSAEMQEKMKVIQLKYKNNPEKLNQETLELYKKEKVSPFSGCLSVILQFIIFISVFYLVSKPLTYMKKIDTDVIKNYENELKDSNTSSTYTELKIISQKGEEDPNVYINMNFFGLDLNKVPNQNISDPTVYIIPALYILTTFISIKVTNNMQENLKGKKKQKDAELENKGTDKTPENEQDETLESMQEMSKSMTYMMPIMSIFISFITPLGLALYWLVSNVLMIAERFIVDIITKEKENLQKID